MRLGIFFVCRSGGRKLKWTRIRVREGKSYQAEWPPILRERLECRSFARDNIRSCVLTLQSADQENGRRGTRRTLNNDCLDAGVIGRQAYGPVVRAHRG